MHFFLLRMRPSADVHITKFLRIRCKSLTRQKCRCKPYSRILISPLYHKLGSFQGFYAAVHALCCVRLWSTAGGVAKQ